MSTDKLDIEAVRKHLLSALRTTVYATLKQALDELEEARNRIAELEKRLPSAIPVPEHWPHRYNANSDPCDMIDGPCACGAWHSLDEVWVQSGMNRYGEKS